MRRSPKDSAESVRRISRRGVILGGVQLAFSAALGLRMQHLQVDQADEFRLLAEENRINIRLIPPTRGQIFDRNGMILAANELSNRIAMVKEDAGSVDDVIARLTESAPFDQLRMQRLKKRKLALKDEIAKVESRILPDIIA